MVEAERQHQQAELHVVCSSGVSSISLTPKRGHFHRTKSVVLIADAHRNAHTKLFRVELCLLEKLTQASRVHIKSPLQFPRILHGGE